MKFTDLFGSNNVSSNAQTTVVSETPVAPQPASITSTTINPIVQQDISVLSHLDPRSTTILSASAQEAKKNKKSMIEPSHLMLALLSDREIFKLLSDFSVDPAKTVRELQQAEEVGTFEGQPVLSEQ